MILDIEFNRQPGVRCRRALMDAGFAYHADIRSWRSKQNHALGVRIAEKAVETSRALSSGNQKETLCWSCDNACGGCEWSCEAKPVPEWDAKATKRRAVHGRIGNKPKYVIEESFDVKSCPKYVPDRRGK